MDGWSRLKKILKTEGNSGEIYKMRKNVRIEMVEDFSDAHNLGKYARKIK